MIELVKVNKSYEKKNIIKDFSLKINKGEIVAITGQSGKGKSTLLNIIGLLEECDSGDVIIDDYKNVKINSNKSTDILRKKISYLFQNYALVDEETVKYNLLLALKYVKVNKKEKINRISGALNKVGLNGYENKRIYQLSGGEQQRVALARVLLKPSEVILADEPTGSLDARNRDKILDLLFNLNKEDNKTIIIVTHDLEVANRCNRIVKL